MIEKNNRNHFNNRNILPSARILQEYESLAPGFTSKLTEMAKKEQEHRHSWQNCYLKFHNITFFSGQIFGFIYNILLLGIIFKLIKSGELSLALKLFIANILLMAFAIIVSFSERKSAGTKIPSKDRKSYPEKSAAYKKDAHKERGSDKNQHSRNRGGNHNRKNRP